MRTVLGSPELSRTAYEVQRPRDPNREDFKRKGWPICSSLFAIMSGPGRKDMFILRVFAVAKAREASEGESSFLPRGWLGVNGFKSEQPGRRREHSLTLRLEFVLTEKVPQTRAPPWGSLT